MKKIRNIWRFYWPNIVLIIYCVAICHYLKVKGLFLVDSSKTIDLTNYNSIISGFLFTAISVLISALSNDRINRLMKHSYLNKYFFSIIVSLIFSIIAIIINLMYVYINVDAIISCLDSLQKIVISLTLISSIFFIQAIYYIIKLLYKLLKN